MLTSYLYLFFAAASVAFTFALPSLPDCAASDTNLNELRYTLCRSLVGPGVQWCLYPTNTSSAEDFPNQAVYFNNIILALISPSTCLNTATAHDVVTWLNASQADSTVSGAFMNTWVVFQAQYYDMPRNQGERIESSDTLGRKCWAFAFLAQMWGVEALPLSIALNAVGLSVEAYSSAAGTAIPQTLELCEEVMANCFINASYNPARNGTCPGDIFSFRWLGFERENILRANIVEYPFF